LQPWERVALLIAAVGLHSGVGQTDSAGTLTGKDPLLAHGASAGQIFQALHSSDFAGAGANAGTGELQFLVRRLFMRAKPRCILDDARKLKTHFERDDQLPETPAERSALVNLVLAAADLSFLALPPQMHRPWSVVCQKEGQAAGFWARPATENSGSVEVDVASWLHGLIEVLALPVYETLCTMDGGQKHLAVAVTNLRDNAKHWKVTKLTAISVDPKNAPPDDGLYQFSAENSVCTTQALSLMSSLTQSAEDATYQPLPGVPENPEGSQNTQGSSMDDPYSCLATMPPVPLGVGCEQSINISAVLGSDFDTGTLVPGTLPPGTLPAGTLPPGPDMDLGGTLAPGTLVPGTLLPGTLTPDDLSAAGAPKGDGANRSSATSTSNSSPTPTIPVPPRAKLPGEVYDSPRGEKAEED